MGNNIPSVSVVMTVYNTPEQYLRTAVDSILKQTLRDFELIIIDDCSTDGSAGILRSYHDERVIYVRNEVNMGPTVSSNRGLSLVRGKYVARMDSDDVSLPNRLQKQYEYLEKHPEITALATGVKYIGMEKGVGFLSPINPKEILIDLFFDNRLCHSSVMIRKDFLDKYKITYDESIKKSLDYELWTRCAKLGRIAVLKKTLVLYRVHDKQITYVSRAEQDMYANEIRRRMLYELGTGTKEKAVPGEHIALCIQNPIEGIKAEKVGVWAEMLIQLNNKKGIYDLWLFERAVMTHWMVLAFKMLTRCKVSLKTLLNLQSFKRALLPRYYSGYISYLLTGMRRLLGKLFGI